MKPPIRIAVTGATGQICYSLLFRIASGDMLGKDQPIILQLLDIPDLHVKKSFRTLLIYVFRNSGIGNLLHKFHKD